MLPALPTEQALDRQLTPRERQVLELLAEGLSDKAIASEMGISVETVRTHLVSVFGKLGATSRLQAVVHALRRRIIRFD